MNPYEVLGVSPNATQEEIRAAYIKLVKKYHPDRYQDSALKKQAEDRMKRINAAYDMLTKNRDEFEAAAGGRQGYSQGGAYGGGTYSGSGTAYGGTYGRSQTSGYKGEYAEDFDTVRILLNTGDVAGAMAKLGTIPLRNAEWNFLYGMCCYRNGYYSRAYTYISNACRMDPDNAEYAAALSAMRGGTKTQRSWTDNGGTLRFCGIFSSILCANLLCRWCCI